MANEADATKREAGDDEDDVHRLRDIVVEEVSLVDRAANKRRFLVVKRSGDMPNDETLGAEVKEDDRDGTAEARVEKAKRKPKVDADNETDKASRRSSDDDDADETEKARRDPDDEEETTKAQRSKPGEEDDEPTARKAAMDDEEGEQDDEEEEEDEECMEKARSRPKGRSGEPNSEDDADESPAEKSSGERAATSSRDSVLRTLTKALEQLMEVTKKVQKAEGKNGRLPDSVAIDLASITKVLEGIGGARPASPKAALAKAGARMAKDRLDRFQKALALLSDVLKELTDAKKKPWAPTAGTGGVEKRAPDQVPGLKDLVSGIGELTRVVKRQEEELGRIRQARGISNAIQVDGGGRRPEPQDVSWPLDMNRPISRDSVAKAVSFYEE